MAVGLVAIGGDFGDSGVGSDAGGDGDFGPVEHLSTELADCFVRVQLIVGAVLGDVQIGFIHACALEARIVLSQHFSHLLGLLGVFFKIQWKADELGTELHSDEVLTRQVVPPKAVSTADDLYTYALPMFQRLERERGPGMTLRLMGLRCTHLVSTKKEDVDFFGLKRPISTSSSANPIPTPNGKTETDADGHEWQVWPEDEFETAAWEEREEEFDQLEKLSQEYEKTLPHASNNNNNNNNNNNGDLKINQSSTRSQKKASEEADRRLRQTARKNQTDIPAYPKKEYRNTSSDITPSKPNQGTENSKIWHCPICSRPQVARDRDFNDHVDYCLSRGTIREAVETGEEENNEAVNFPPIGLGKEGASVSGGAMAWFGGNEKMGSGGRGKGRARGKRKGESGGGEEARRKKSFFG